MLTAVGAARAVQGHRRRPALQRLRGRDAHDHRVAARRHARHAALDARARAARHARRARRGAARGRRHAPARAVAQGHRAGRRCSRRSACGADVRRALRGSTATSAALTPSGGGAAATFLGVALLSPLLVRPLASLVGRPLERMRGITGRLARENTTRQPGRTAATAAALMIGVALVTFASIFAAGAKRDDQRAVDQNLTRGARRAERRRLLGRSPRRPCAAVAERPEVRGGQPDALLPGQGRRRRRELVGHRRRRQDLHRALQARRRRRAATPPIARARGGRTTMIGKGFAEDQRPRGRRPCSTCAPRTTGARGLRVSGIFDDERRPARATSPSTNRVLERDFGERKDAFALVALREGEDAAAIERRLSGLLDRTFPAVEVLTAEQFKDKQSRPDQPAAGPDLRAAGAHGDRVAVRDRQHARAVDLRAHARAGHAARDRHLAPPGAQDGALGGGDHVADRRGPGLGPGDPARGPLHPPLDDFVLIDPGVHARDPAHPRGDRRRPGGGAPGAARVTAGRAGGAGLRVARTAATAQRTAAPSPPA